MSAGRSREDQFARLMAERGSVLIRQPRTFWFTHSSYRPDFYDPHTGAYYEVIGTRQRGFTIRYQLDLMLAHYPDIDLRVVRPDGSPYEVHAGLRTIALDYADVVDELRLTMKLRGLSGRMVSSVTGIALRTIKKALSREPVSEFVVERLRRWLDDTGATHQPITRAHNRGRLRVPA